MKQSLKKILPVLMYGIVELLIIIELMNFLGFGITPIVSPSMTPTLPVNSLIMTYKAPIESIQTDDIIEFKLPNADYNYMHRVLTNYGSSKEPAFRTKGDANEQTDRWFVTAEEYKGKLIYHLNWVAPFVTIVFGSFLTVSKSRLIIGLLCVGLVSSMILGMLTIGTIKIIFKIMRGVKKL